MDDKIKIYAAGMLTAGLAIGAFFFGKHTGMLAEEEECRETIEVYADSIVTLSDIVDELSATDTSIADDCCLPMATYTPSLIVTPDGEVVINFTYPGLPGDIKYWWGYELVPTMAGQEVNIYFSQNESWFDEHSGVTKKEEVRSEELSPEIMKATLLLEGHHIPTDGESIFTVNALVMDMDGTPKGKGTSVSDDPIAFH